MEIEVAPYSNLGSRLWNAFRLLFSRGAVIQEMALQEDDLRTQYDKLLRSVGELEEQRRVAEHALLVKSEFLGVMSHELRTPLNGICGAAFLFREDGHVDQLPTVEMLESSANDLLQLIEKLLAFTEMSRGERRGKPVDFGPRAVLIAAIAEVRAEADKKGLAIECQLSGETLPQQISGDAEVFAEVAAEVLKNAVMFSDAGVIRVELDAEMGASGDDLLLRLTVSDEGIGIAPEHCEKVFDSFFSVEQSSTRTQRGVGLGLASCRRLLGSVGGSIELRSDLGKGSTVRVLIPCGPAPAGQALARGDE